MNLYLLLAIALSAISGVTEAPVARPGFASVVSERAERADVQAARAADHVMVQASRPAATPRVEAPPQRRPDAPLTGAGTTRAPSACC